MLLNMRKASKTILVWLNTQRTIVDMFNLLFHWKIVDMKFCKFHFDLLFLTGDTLITTMICWSIFILYKYSLIIIWLSQSIVLKYWLLLSLLLFQLVLPSWINLLLPPGDTMMHCIVFELAKDRHFSQIPLN